LPPFDKSLHNPSRIFPLSQHEDLHGAVMIVSGGIGPNYQAPKDGARLRMLMMVLGRKWIVRVAGNLFPAVLAPIDPRPWNRGARLVVGGPHRFAAITLRDILRILVPGHGSAPPTAPRLVMQNNTLHPRNKDLLGLFIGWDEVIPHYPCLSLNGAPADSAA
jgi:hypothetical protein